MDPASQLARIERVLREMLQVLGKAPPSARTRELKARAGTFERAFMNFAGRAPRIEQTSALLESVMELQARVCEALPNVVPNVGAGVGSGVSSRPVIINSPRLSLPTGRPSQRPTGKPPPFSPLSPSVRPTQPPPPSFRPTQPPPSSSRPTKPPPSSSSRS